MLPLQQTNPLPHTHTCNNAVRASLAQPSPPIASWLPWPPPSSCCCRVRGAAWWLRGRAAFEALQLSSITLHPPRLPPWSRHVSKHSHHSDPFHAVMTPLFHRDMYYSTINTILTSLSRHVHTPVTSPLLMHSHHSSQHPPPMPSSRHQRARYGPATRPCHRAQSGSPDHWHARW